MRETYVILETARLAKIKNFNWTTNKCYDVENNYNLVNAGYNANIDSRVGNLSAPTQSVLQKWLREKHNQQIYCYSSTLRNGKWGDYVVYVNGYALNDARDEEFQTYEDALEIGLCYALNKI